MQEIATVLEAARYEVFLPQRDGIEMSRVHQDLVARGMPDATARDILARSIFLIDTYQVAHCDGLILNLNGRVPDEGAMVEAGIAWGLHKPVVIYKNDGRSAVLGDDNPLVLGLSSFRTVKDIAEIPGEFGRHFANGYSRSIPDLGRPENRNLKRGRAIHSLLSKQCLSPSRAQRLKRILQE